MSDNVILTNNLPKEMVLLVGAGYMAKEYAKVLKAQNVPFTVVSRGEEKARIFEQEIGTTVISGGLDAYLRSLNCSLNSARGDNRESNRGDKSSLENLLPSQAIVAVNVDQLASTAVKLLRFGVKRIFLEKPGGVKLKELESLQALAEEKQAEIYLAYNRRFYSSVRKARDIIEADGGVRSFHFEFTEWRHIFDQRENKKGLEYLFLGNSSHVVDMAFFLATKTTQTSSKIGVVSEAVIPTKLSSTIGGIGEIEWHPCGSIFAGHGEISNGAIFTYCADWNAPGRWSVYVNTEKHKLIFMPLEKLKIQEKGSIQIKDVEIEDEQIDIDFKPGLYKEVEAFLTGKGGSEGSNGIENLCTLKDQINRMDVFAKISGEDYN